MTSTGLRARLAAWWRALHDPDVPWRRRATVWMALVYVISPFDIVPEALLSVAGLGDDLAVALFLLRSLWTLPEPRHLSAGRDDGPTLTDPR